MVPVHVCDQDDHINFSAASSSNDDSDLHYLMGSTIAGITILFGAKSISEPSRAVSAEAILRRRRLNNYGGFSENNQVKLHATKVFA